MKLLKPIKVNEDKSPKKRKKRTTVNKGGIFKKLFVNKRVRRNIENRNKEIKKRKSLIPSVVITILFWLSTFYIIMFVDPLEEGSVQLFFVSLFLSLLFTLSIIFSNRRRGLFMTSSIIFFLFLRYFGIGNAINILLIAGLTITAEIYFSKK